MYIIIDGYNLIRQSDHLRSFDRRSLEEGRSALIQFLAAYKRAKEHTITVVFDAWDGGGPVEERDRQAGIEIIYSRRGRQADDVIKAMVEKRTGVETLVVSSDRDVADYAAHRGASAVSSLEFERAVLRFYLQESVPSGRDEDEEGVLQAKGTKKKGPARRISRGAKEYQKRIRKL
jgi:predicted RNA-binding protein with PIN domain